MDMISKFTDKLKVYFPTLKHYFDIFLNMFKNIFGIYVLWVFVHYVSAHIYVRFCTPGTFVGFILSPFMAAAPHCQALRWALYNGGNSIISMWVTVGLWLLGYLKPITNNFIGNNNVNEKND
jgi:hypothetical protein